MFQAGIFDNCAMKWLFVFGLLVVISVDSRSVVEPQNNIEYIIAEKQESMTTVS